MFFVWVGCVWAFRSLGEWLKERQTAKCGLVPRADLSVVVRCEWGAPLSVLLCCCRRLSAAPSVPPMQHWIRDTARHAAMGLHVTRQTYTNTHTPCLCEHRWNSVWTVLWFTKHMECVFPYVWRVTWRPMATCMAVCWALSPCEYRWNSVWTVLWFTKVIMLNIQPDILRWASTWPIRRKYTHHVCGEPQNCSYTLFHKCSQRDDTPISNVVKGIIHSKNIYTHVIEITMKDDIYIYYSMIIFTLSKLLKAAIHWERERERERESKTESAQFWINHSHIFSEQQLIFQPVCHTPKNSFSPIEWLHKTDII